MSTEGQTMGGEGYDVRTPGEVRMTEGTDTLADRRMSNFLAAQPHERARLAAKNPRFAALDEQARAMGKVK